MREVLRRSWNHTHRLGQTAQDGRRGLFRPNHTTAARSFPSGLDLTALNRAWHAVQVRHPALLSAWDPDGSDWFVDCCRPADLILLAQAVDPAAADVALKAECARPFDLEWGPAARLVVVPGGDGVRLALTVEHLVSDGWSLDLLVRDLAWHYRLERGSDRRPPPPVARSFQDVVRAQNDFVASASGRRLLDLEAARLRAVGAVPAMPVAGFTPAGTVRHECLGAVTRRVDGRLRAALQRLGRPYRLTALNVMNAALHQALHARSGGERVATTLSTANRNVVATHRTVGWFASKVVLVTEPAGRPDPVTYLPHFRDRFLDALDASRMPWPAVIARMDPASLGRNPQVPYVTFNGRSRSMRRIGGTGPTDPGEAGFGEPLPLSLRWHDAAIATFWDEDEDGVEVSIDVKLDWYDLASVAALWDVLEDRMTAWAGSVAG